MTQVEPNDASTCAAQQSARAKRPRRSPYPHLFRVLHWVLPASLVASVLTGLSLHAVARPGWSLFGGNLPGWFWPGQVHVVHLVSAAVFVPALLAGAWFYARRKVRRRWTHLTLLGGGLAVVLTGALLAHPVGPGWLYGAARAVHALTGLVVLPVALAWHVYHGLGPLRGALVPAFHPWATPRWLQIAVFAPLVLVTAGLALNVLPPGMAGRELVARRIPRAEVDLEALDALPWDSAPPLVVELANGAGFDGGRTRAVLRALHDGEELFVLAEWDDPTEDRLYQPWEKTADGWNRWATSADDESVYYEDKFALAFPAQSDWRFDRAGCALYCHAASGRPYGYKASDYVVDEWHWKAVRTDPVGQVDDKHWLGRDAKSKHVGRQDDAFTGGYQANGAKDSPHPSLLPDDLAAIGQGHFPRGRAVKYSEETAARIPPGTLIPGILTQAFEGDRGDIGARGRYESGRWRLAMRRRLDTGSPHDVRFMPGESHGFGCAAFDHTSNRHAYSLGSLRLVLEP